MANISFKQPDLSVCNTNRGQERESSVRNMMGNLPEFKLRGPLECVSYFGTDITRSVTVLARAASEK